MWHVGDVVRKLRIAQELTLQELADEAGVDIKTVSRIERGDVSGTRESLGLIAKALGLPQSASALDEKKHQWSVDDAGPAGVSSDTREIVVLWERLNDAPERQRVLLGLMRREVREAVRSALWVRFAAAAIESDGMTHKWTGPPLSDEELRELRRITQDRDKREPPRPAHTAQGSFRTKTRVKKDSPEVTPSDTPAEIEATPPPPPHEPEAGTPGPGSSLTHQRRRDDRKAGL